MVKNPQPQALFHTVRHLEGAVWLDGGQLSRSIIAWDPVEVIAGDVDFREAGRSLMRKQQSSTGFTGVIGMIGFGAGHHVEAVPPTGPTPEPPVWLGRFETTAVWEAGSWTTHGPVESAFAAAKALPPVPPAPLRRSCTTPRQLYLDAVQAILQSIEAGDCYQVNLSRAVHVSGVHDPFETYRRLRSNDASMGAYLALRPDLAVLSNSPELLLAAQDERVWSVPIKGTRPRSADPVQDERQRHALLHSPKDHAELAMIVDLVRNDLGRVARRGSVRWGTRELVAHGNVFHTHWPVHATLRDGVDAWDALAALFPPGSVTGTPKIRATERIHQLETEPRGAYCGSIGFVSDRGEAAWSVSIRTGVWHETHFRYHVGGGVVHDSVPSEEYAETQAKGTALAEAVGAVSELLTFRDS